MHGTVCRDHVRIQPNIAHAGGEGNDGIPPEASQDSRARYGWRGGPSHLELGIALLFHAWGTMQTRHNGVSGIAGG
jgi:hypothetical protein